MTPLPRHAHLASLCNDLDAVRARTERLDAELTDEQLTWKPAARSWSIAGCFEHLRLTDAAYERAILRAIDGATRQSDPPPYRRTLAARLLTLAVDPKVRIPLPAPPAVRAKPHEAEASAVGDFLQQQAAIRRLMMTCDGFDLNAIRVASPMSRFVRLSLGDAFTIVVRHQQRHLGQALRVREHEAFPVTA